MTIARPAAVTLVLFALAASGCTTRPPTIAHTHIGHALTAVHVTPEKEGYFIVAEQQAETALDAAQRAHAAGHIEDIKADVSQALASTDSEEGFGVKQAVVHAANHISFAATSRDASINVQRSAPDFSRDIVPVVSRCELITRLGDDVLASDSGEEIAVLTEEILRLAQANVSGEDSNGDGEAGSMPAEYGLLQLRNELDELIAREDPPYVTVDTWYLFNLVRLPNGNWVFDKLGRGGNIDGYQ